MRKTRIVNAVLAVALAAAMLFPGMSVFAQDSLEKGTSEEEKPVESVTAEGTGALPDFTTKLLKVVGKEKNPVASGNTLSIQDTLVFGIKKDKLSDIVAGNTYTATLPEGLKVTTKGSSIVNTDVTVPPKKFATLNWEVGSQTLNIVFNELEGATEEVKLNNLINVYMYFECSLDEDKIQDKDDQGNASITMPYGEKLSIKVSELMPRPPELEKAVGVLGDDGTATWTVTYKHPLDAYKGDKPTVLTDTLPEGLEYVTGSATVSVNGTGKTIDDTNFKHENKDENGVITYTLPSSLTGGAVVALTYKTSLSDKVMSDIWSKPNGENKYMNFAEAKKDSDSLNPKLEAKKELVIPKDWTGRKMLSKNGKVSDDKRSIKWTVTVNTASRGFEHLYVIDTMGKGLTLNPGTVEIDSDGTKVTVTPTVIKTADDKTEMTIKLVEGKTPATAAAKYVIKYTTTIKDTYFDPNSTEEFSKDDVSNKARLSYSWPDGKGPGEDMMPPEIGKGPGEIDFDQALVKKSADSYDYTSRKLTWNVTVNPNKVNLTAASIVDDLTGKEQVFYLDENDKASVEATIRAAVKTGSGLETTDFNLSQTKLAFKLGNIGTNAFSFKIETYSSEAKNWAVNVANKEYLNEVVMKKNDTTIGGASLNEDKKGSAINKVTHTVLEKSHTGYNAVDNELTWTLVVNKDKVPLGNVDLTDELPEGLSYVESSAELDNSVFSGDNTFNANGNEIKIHLDNVSVLKTITFKTKVDVNTDNFKENETVDIKNVVEMKSRANGEKIISSSSTAAISNKVMSKASVNNDGTIKYKVEINPIQMKLSNEQTVDFTDTLSEGLFFDISTFKLYEATRSVSGSAPYTVGLSKGTEIMSAPVKQKDAFSFTVTLPDSTKSYIAEYDAYALKEGSLKNSVALGESLISGNGHGSSTAVAEVGSGGGAGLGKLPAGAAVSFTIKNVDEKDDSKPLKGARFGVYSRSGVLLGTYTCGDNGEAAIVFPEALLQGETGFYIQQIEPPSDQGFVINTSKTEISTDKLPSSNTPIIMENGDKDLNPYPPSPPTPSPPQFPNYNWGSASSSVDEDAKETVPMTSLFPADKQPAPPITDIPKTGLDDYLAAYIIIMLLAVFNGGILIAKQIKKRKLR